MIGRRLNDRYVIERVIARGGMGTVFAATDLHMDKPVAVKWLNQMPRNADRSAVARFEREAKIAGALASRHLVKVLDAARDPDTGVPFLVMELLHGEDVQEQLERLGSLSPDAALRIAAQACVGLQVAHAAGVVHRDIKPANLFLQRGEGGALTVRIVDFGVAKILPLPPDRHEASPLGALPAGLTSSGRVLGSPLYLSPEQLHADKNVDARSDLFSLGVTLYAMLVGEAPHAKVKSFTELLVVLSTKPPEPVHLRAPWVPEEVSAIIVRATRLDREARFQSAAAMLEAILERLPNGPELREEMLPRSAPPPGR